jgi:hypothetical protein
VTTDDAIADRPAVVVHVEPEGAEVRLLEQALDDLREPVERVLEVVGHVAVAEARIVGRQDMEAVGDSGDQVAELMRRGGKAAEQQQFGILGVPGLTVEDGESIDVGCPVSDADRQRVTCVHLLLLSGCVSYRGKRE